VRIPRAVAILALPLLVYLIPLAQGFAWSALGAGFNVLDPPEGYAGRLPELRITAEAWGASVVIVPLHAKIRDYVLAGDLPLWNPYQGLGQPFAAQGEGSPYFPAAVLRSLLPYSWANYVTVGMFFASSLALFGFVRGLGASRAAACFGGVAWPLSGALSLHLARPNIADQLCMIPVLFWATERAVRAPSLARWAALALVAGLHAVAGFIQIAMIAALAALLFALVYARALRPAGRAWLSTGAIAAGVFVVGNALAAFTLLPMLESMRVSFNKNHPLLAFLPMPDANLLAFFAPYVFGYPFHTTWVPGEFPWVVSWDNLYGFSGLTLALAPLAVLPSLRNRPRVERWALLFFVGAAVLLLLRYLSVAPVAMVNLLPILDRQSPKHSTGLAVFCLVVAASLAIDMLGQADRRRGRLAIGLFLGYLASLLLTIVGRQGGFAAIDPVDVAVRSTAASLVVALAAALMVDRALIGQPRRANEWTNGPLSGRAPGAASERPNGWAAGHVDGPTRAALLLGGAAVAELALYVPLGNAAPWFLGARLALGGLVLAAALLASAGRVRPAVAPVLLTLVGHAALVGLPSVGLPSRFEADAPPAFMRWLAEHAGPDDRSFGIMPDASATARLHDISAVGPLAPPDFFRFVTLISDERTAREYEQTTHFMLAGPWQFDLAQYRRMQLIFDWAGVRHLVLNKQAFASNDGAGAAGTGGSGAAAGTGERTDHAAILADAASFRLAYEDDRVRIVESLHAAPRAEFWTRAIVVPDQVTAIAELRAAPEQIRGVPRVEAGPGLPARLDALTEGPAAGPVPVTIAGARPNTVELSVEAPAAGLLVLKDATYPGWSATIDGRAAEILRVNGFARGVYVPEAGRHDVRFEYRPASFVAGTWLTLAVAAFLVLGTAWGALSAARRRRGDVPARSDRGLLQPPVAAVRDAAR